MRHCTHRAPLEIVSIITGRLVLLAHRGIYALPEVACKILMRYGIAKKYPMLDLSTPIYTEETWGKIPRHDISTFTLPYFAKLQIEIEEQLVRQPEDAESDLYWKDCYGDS